MSLSYKSLTLVLYWTCSNPFLSRENLILPCLRSLMTTVSEICTGRRVSFPLDFGNIKVCGLFSSGDRYDIGALIDWFNYFPFFYNFPQQSIRVASRLNNRFESQTYMEIVFSSMLIKLFHQHS